MNMPRFQIRGFTLLELLVATSLTLVIVLIATTVLFQMIKTTRRINATMAMHAMAHRVQDRLARDTAAMHPCAAVWLVSDPTARSVELIFLRGKEHAYDFSVSPEVGKPNSVVKLGFTDLVWTRWYWTEAEGILSVAESRSARQFLLDNGNGTTRNFWQIANNMEVSATSPTRSTFISVPQPRRETDLASRPGAVSKPSYVLNQNSWKSDLSATAQAYLSADLGDYDDLVRNARPVLHGCSKLTIELVDATPPPSSNVQSAGVRDNGTWYPSLDWAAAGSFVDGGLASAGSNRGLTTSDRPGLIRIRFTLSDPSRTDATFAYSFSLRTPHPAPY